VITFLEISFALFYARGSLISQTGFATPDSNPPKRVIGEVQAAGCSEVLPLLRNAIRQPRQSAHLQADREILTLNDAGTESGRIGTTQDWDHLRIQDFSRRVAALAFRNVVIAPESIVE
jgi:hypothetical protein